MADKNEGFQIKYFLLNKQSVFFEKQKKTKVKATSSFSSISWALKSRVRIGTVVKKGREYS